MRRPARGAVPPGLASALFGLAAALAACAGPTAAPDLGETSHAGGTGVRTVCATGCDHVGIQDAVDAAVDGDTVVVSPGTYEGALVLDRSVTLRAAEHDRDDPRNNTTVIDGAGAEAVITVPAGVTPGPSVVGFAIRNAESDGISPASPVTVEYCHLTDAEDLIDVERGGGGVIRGSVFEGAGDDAIDLDNPDVDLLVEDNVIVGSEQDGIEIRLQDDDLPTEAVTTIRRNEIRGSGQDGIQLIDYATTTNRRFVISDNLVVDSGLAAIGMMDAEETEEDLRAAPVREPVDVVGNTLVGNGAGISGGANLVAVNNIVAGNREFGLKGVAGDSLALHNLLHDNGVDLQGANNVEDSSTLFADPLLTPDYRLREGSPARGAGASTLTWNGRTVLPGPPPSAPPDLGW